MPNKEVGAGAMYIKKADVEKVRYFKSESPVKVNHNADMH